MPSKNLTSTEVRSRLRLCASSNRRYKARLQQLQSDHDALTRQYKSLLGNHAPQEFRKELSGSPEAVS